MKIEKGTKLIAIDPHGNALIIGKEYIVIRVKPDDYVGEVIVIKSEVDDNHHFGTSELKHYFTFPENTTDNSL